MDLFWRVFCWWCSSCAPFQLPTLSSVSNLAGKFLRDSFIKSLTKCPLLLKTLEKCVTIFLRHCGPFSDFQLMYHVFTHWLMEVGQYDFCIEQLTTVHCTECYINTDIYIYICMFCITFWGDQPMQCSQILKRTISRTDLISFRLKPNRNPIVLVITK